MRTLFVSSLNDQAGLRDCVFLEVEDNYALLRRQIETSCIRTESNLEMKISYANKSKRYSRFTSTLKKLMAFDMTK